MSKNKKDLEDLKFLTELFGNEDLAAPEGGVVTLEEIETQLTLEIKFKITAHNTTKEAKRYQCQIDQGKR